MIAGQPERLPELRAISQSKGQFHTALLLPISRKLSAKTPRMFMRLPEYRAVRWKKSDHTGALIHTQKTDPGTGRQTALLGGGPMIDYPLVAAEVEVGKEGADRKRAGR